MLNLKTIKIGDKIKLIKADIEGHINYTKEMNLKIGEIYTFHGYFKNNDTEKVKYIKIKERGEDDWLSIKCFEFVERPEKSVYGIVKFLRSIDAAAATKKMNS